MILQGVEFPIFLLIFAWALQQCSAKALPVITSLIHNGKTGRSPVVQTIWQSVKIWQSYSLKVGTFLRHSVYYFCNSYNYEFRASFTCYRGMRTSRSNILAQNLKLTWSSDWIDVLSGVPQGLVLSPVLFLIFINDLDYGIESWILKFADDTTIFNRVNCTADVERLQKDLHSLITWFEEWYMLFNVSKWKVVHVGTMQFERQYFMNDQKLEVVTQEKDLGVLISNVLMLDWAAGRSWVYTIYQL